MYVTDLELWIGDDVNDIRSMYFTQRPDSSELYAWRWWWRRRRWEWCVLVALRYM